MATLYYEGMGYEGGGFLRANVVFAAPKGKLGRPVKMLTPSDAEVEKRERELRREYLPEWICKLLEA